MSGAAGRPSDRLESGPLVGVLAGGRGLRMGGVDKAALPAPGSSEPLLARLLRVASEAGLEAVVVDSTHPERRCPVPQLADDPPGVGPLGGLCALLAHAGERTAIALACDLPFLEADLLARLAREASAAPVLAPRDPETGKWQPLFARYDAARVLPVLRAAIARGTRSFQALFRDLPVAEFALDLHERAQLRDWDAPGDFRR